MDVLLLAHAGPHISASVVVGLTLGSIAAVWWGARNPGSQRTHDLLTAAMLAGLSFQVIHGAEHVIQVGAWVGAPSQPPFLTPWAVWGRDVLAITDGSTTTGAELLHLIGNVLFMVGIVAAHLLFRARHVPSGEMRAFRAACIVQGFHVGEHVLLTVSWLAFGRTLGFSTAFGALQGDPVVSGAVRVWVHFGLNAAATVLAFVGVWKGVNWAPARRSAEPGRIQEARVLVA